VNIPNPVKAPAPPPNDSCAHPDKEGRCGNPPQTLVLISHNRFQRRTCSFKSSQPCREGCSLPPWDSSLLPADSLACIPDPLEGCNIIPPTRSDPGHKASWPHPSQTPEFPVHSDISANLYRAAGDFPWVTVIWHRSTGTRGVLGKGRLNEDEFRNHKITLASLRKGEEREGREEGQSLITDICENMLSF